MREVKTMNHTKTIMNENISYFLDFDCNLDIEGLATFGLDNGDLSEIRDESDLYRWAREIEDVLEGRF